MKIAVLSDIHDNLWNLRTAIGHVSDAGALICCGDLCSPFVMDQLAKFPGPVHIVFGNNDADLFRITRKSSARVQVHGEFFEAELDGKTVAVNHFDNIARPVALSGIYNLVCYGHNHEFRVMRLGKTLAINPGPIMGAKFPGGQWTDVVPTFVVYDTRADGVEAFEIGAGGVIRPHEFVFEETWA
jgi:putative phosphoesterase